MRTSPTIVLSLFLLTAAISGCIADQEPKGTDSTSTSPAATSGSTSPTPTTTAPAPVAPIANLTLNSTNGSVPLNVSFAITDDSGADQENVTWTLVFGDGNSTNGTSLPGRTNYTYASNGSFEALLTIKTAAGESTDNETVTAVGGSAVPPSQTVYESGPVVGCVTEGGYANCPAYELGPGNEEGFGIWIEVEPGHVGMQFITSGTAGGDSDGWMFADPAGAPLTDINNGGGEAGGIVTPDVKWILIVSWAAPSDNMVVTFTPVA